VWIVDVSFHPPLTPFRYGLYSSPFDPVLFDLEVSGSSCKNAFNSSTGVQSDEIDLSDILSGRRRLVVIISKLATVCVCVCVVVC